MKRRYPPTPTIETLLRMIHDLEERVRMLEHQRYPLLPQYSHNPDNDIIIPLNHPTMR